jgi:two-component system NtrC family sensor kinase
MGRMFDTVQSGVKRIGNTVDLMVRYSREGYTRAIQPYDVYGAVRDVVGIVVPATGSDAKVEVSLDGSGVIECVPEEMNQTLTNLIQNALEAVEPGRGVVSVKGHEDDGELVIVIRDNGVGIESSALNRIFTAFYSTKEVGRGLGMGLTIARRCVVALGGSINVRSAKGTGTEFTVRVPREQQRRREPPLRSGAPANDPGSPGARA